MHIVVAGCMRFVMSLAWDMADNSGSTLCAGMHMRLQQSQSSKFAMSALLKSFQAVHM